MDERIQNQNTLYAVYLSSQNLNYSKQEILDFSGYIYAKTN